MKSKLEIIAKSIKIDGDKYGMYTFKEKDYFTTAVKFNTIYNGYIFGVASFFGERAFSVLNDGSRVQHHAMRQDETYIIKLGKKFKNFDVIASYSYQKGKELPKNQENVKTKTTSLNLKYKF